MRRNWKKTHIFIRFLLNFYLVPFLFVMLSPFLFSYITIHIHIHTCSMCEWILFILYLFLIEKRTFHSLPTFINEALSRCPSHYDRSFIISSTLIMKFIDGMSETSYATYPYRFALFLVIRRKFHALRMKSLSEMEKEWICLRCIELIESIKEWK